MDHAGRSQGRDRFLWNVACDYVINDWLAEHCWEYGFILRYPEGKSDITGIQYERWHFRYVGVELAKELKDLGLCLEEYMDMLTQREGYGAGTSSNPELFMVTETENAA